MPEVRIRVLCTAHPVDDSWLYCDMLLMRQLLPRVSDERWLVPEDFSQPNILPDLKLHGHPNAERACLDADAEPFNWFDIVEESILKQTFLAEVAATYAAAGPEDVIVLLINGHRSDAPEAPGQIEAGTINDGVQYLTPQDLFSVIPAHITTTLILNSCFSGAWVQYALSNDFQGKLTILARCKDTDEILSFATDSNGVLCGGYFANSLVNEFYKEYGYHFPRPGTLSGLQNGSPYNEYHYPESNIPQIPHNSSRPALTTNTLPDLVTSAATDIELLSPIPPIPLITNSDSTLPGRQAIGVQPKSETPLRLSRLSPPAPAQSPTEASGGRRVRVLRYNLLPLLPAYSSLWVGRTKYLISIYDSFDKGQENAASNTGLSSKIHRYRAGQLNIEEVNLLRKILLGRIAVYHEARKLADSMGAGWELELTPSVREQGRNFAATSRMIQLFYLNERKYGGVNCWVNVARMLGTALSAAGVTGQEFDAFLNGNRDKFKVPI